MYIEIHDEVRKEFRILIENALQYGEHGDYRKLITTAKDVKELPEEYFNSFDIVCMFQILEHMDNLESLFKKITKLTRKNATLFIVVPNEKRVEFDEQNGALLDMPPNHISRWNKKSFEILAKRNGFQVVDYQEEPFNFFRAYRSFIISLYFRKTLNHYSIFNIIERTKNMRIRFVLRKSSTIYLAIISSILIPKLLERKAGHTQWVQLIKL